MNKKLRRNKKKLKTAQKWIGLFVFLLSATFLTAQEVTTIHSILGKGNSSFVVDCDGEYPNCAEEIVKFIVAQKVKDVNRRSYLSRAKKRIFLLPV